MTSVRKNKILLVDDDTKFLKDVKAYLDKLGYAVGTAEDGLAALALAKTFMPDIVVLDMNFVGAKTAAGRSMDGIEVLSRLREIDRVPVLMVSVTNLPSVKVMAFTIGADDYISKPVDLPELAARIEAILRRGKDAQTGEQPMTFQRLRLDPGERRVWKDGKPIEFTGIEFDILYMLARRPEHVFTRDKIIEGAWKSESYCVPKAVDVHIGHIRKKLEDDPLHPTIIITVRGTGYRFEDTPA